MTFQATAGNFEFEEGGRKRSGGVLSQLLPGVAALAVTSVFGAWVLAPALFLNDHSPAKVASAPALNVNVFGPLVSSGFASDSQASSRALALALASVGQPAAVKVEAYGDLSGIRFSAEPSAKSLSEAFAAESARTAALAAALAAQSAALQPKPNDVAPLPPPRPAQLAALEPPRAPSSRTPAPPAPVVDNRNFFEKLFNVQPQSPAAAVANAPTRSVAAQPTAPVIAPPAAALKTAVQSPAAPLTPSTSVATTGGADAFTAVYNISSRTVRMPDGTVFEAHSGLGDDIDDPRHVSERMRGATPPATYEITPREGSFHGVDALRLTPIGDGNVFGRAGLLIHPFMLGPNGDSNGCVSIREYDTFLALFRDGRVKRLVVVAGL